MGDALDKFIVDKNLQCSLCLKDVGYIDKDKEFLDSGIVKNNDKYFCNVKHKFAYKRLMEEIAKEFKKIDKKIKELERKRSSAEIILQKYIPAFPSMFQANNADEILRLIEQDKHDAKSEQKEFKTEGTTKKVNIKFVETKHGELVDKND